MNRAYKLVWNAVSNSWVVASELAKGRKKSSGKAIKLAVLMAAGLSAGVASAVPAENALPTGESVASGSATFDRTVSYQLTVNQSTGKLITNWNSFDIGSNGKVKFVQPNASSIALNRVSSGSATQIFGQLSANGQLVIVNPNGITLGASGQVSAASIIGSVLDIQDSDFDSGNLLFSLGSATGSIDNKGSLTATAGSVSLLAPTVKNSGSITATGGNASLINADQMDINSGNITQSSTVAGLVQSTGSIQASEIGVNGGRIVLVGDKSQSSSTVVLAGTLGASDLIDVTGYTINVNQALGLNADSNLSADRGINFNADTTLATDRTLALVAPVGTDGYTVSYGAKVNLSGAASGFSLNGTAYTVIRDVNALQALSSDLAGNYVLANDIDASISAGWNSGAGFAPIGADATPFTGIVDGLGHRISSLTINRPSTDYVGLIGAAQNSTLRHIDLSNVNISGKSYVGALAGRNRGDAANAYVLSNRVSGSVTGLSYVGGLVGHNDGVNSQGSAVLYKNYSTANVTATGSGGVVGGLVGRNGGRNNGLAQVVVNYFAGSVSSAGFAAGGIVGLNQSSSGLSLVRYNSAAGSVSSTSFDFGGVVGQNYNSGSTVSNNYSSAQVNGSSTFKGGLVGYNEAAIVSNNFWNTETSGLSSAGSGVSGTTNTGLTTAQSTQVASYGNWGITTQGGTGATWRIYEGQTGPLLRNFLKPLTVTGGGGKTYDGTAFNGGSYSLSEAADFSKILGIESYSGTAIGARNAGTYSLQVGGLYSGQNGYDLAFVAGDFVVNKRLLTLSATAASKEYDGKLTAAGKPSITGRVRGDSVVGLTQSFADKNAGTGKTVLVNGGYSIRDGNGGNNYEVLLVDSHDGVITPKALTLSTVANSKVYDGGVTSANKPVVTGLLSGDRVTGLFQQYEDKAVGNNKKLVIRNGYVVDDGNAGNNYAVTEQASNDGVITAH